MPDSCPLLENYALQLRKSPSGVQKARGNGISLWMIGDQCPIEGDPPSQLSTEQAFHGSITVNAAVSSHRVCVSTLDYRFVVLHEIRGFAVKAAPGGPGAASYRKSRFWGS